MKTVSKQSMYILHTRALFLQHNSDSGKKHHQEEQRDEYHELNSKLGHSFF